MSEPIEIPDSWGARWLRAVGLPLLPATPLRYRRYYELYVVPGAFRVSMYRVENFSLVQCELSATPPGTAQRTAMLVGLASQLRTEWELLAGEMPVRWELMLQERGLSLLPDVNQLTMTHNLRPNASDEVLRCAHYIIAEALNEAPQLLLHLYGWHDAQLLKDLATIRAKLAEPLSAEVRAELTTQLQMQRELAELAAATVPENDFFGYSSRIEHAPLPTHGGLATSLQRRSRPPSNSKKMLEQCYQTLSSYAEQLLLRDTQQHQKSAPPE